MSMLGNGFWLQEVPMDHVPSEPRCCRPETQSCNDAGCPHDVGSTFRSMVGVLSAPGLARVDLGGWIERRGGTKNCLQTWRWIACQSR